jgi:hypothetical protein
MQDLDYKTIIKIFNRQIIKEIEEFKVEENCPSYIGKKLFIKDTKLKLTIEDWNKIRIGNYFIKRDHLHNSDRWNLHSIKRDKFIYSELVKYEKTR